MTQNINLNTMRTDKQIIAEYRAELERQIKDIFNRERRCNNDDEDSKRQ